VMAIAGGRRVWAESRHDGSGRDACFACFVFGAALGRVYGLLSDKQTTTTVAYAEVE
jgi:hypothetical protein